MDRNFEKGKIMSDLKTSIIADDLDGGSISSDKGIICPHCGYFDDGKSDPLTLPYVEGETNFQCGDCHDEFELLTDVSYLWTSSKYDEETRPSTEIANKSKGPRDLAKEKAEYLRMASHCSEADREYSAGKFTVKSQG